MPVDIVGGLAAAKEGIAVAKSIAEYLKEKEVDKNEIAQRLLLLQQWILDAQQALNNAQEENRKLKDQLSAQDRLREIEADLEWQTDGGFWIRKSEKEKGVFIPYCPLFWGDNKSKNLMPLNPQQGRGKFFCGIHPNVGYETEAYRQNSANPARRKSPPLGPWS